MGLLDLISGGKALRKPKSIRHGGKRVSDVLEAHEKFHRGQPGAFVAIFRGARSFPCRLARTRFNCLPLAGCNLRGADIRGAKLGQRRSQPI